MTLRVMFGIDPGQTGAVAVLVDGRCDSVFDMPTLKRKSGGLQIDGFALALQIRMAILAHQGAAFAATIEEVQSMPNMASNSVFRFGESYGVALGVLGAMQIPFRTVRPQIWKGACSLIGKDKEDSLRLAQELFPEAAHGLQRKKDHGRAEAILIGMWGGRQEVGA